MKSYILWDHDGVLVETKPWYYEATRVAIAELGVDLAKDDYLRDMAQREIGLGAARATFLRDKDIEIPNVVSVLADLATRYSMAIVTTAKRSDFDLTHRDREIVPHMFFVFASGDYARSKPAPDPYLAALTRFGATAAEAISPSERPRRSNRVRTFPRSPIVERRARGFRSSRLLPDGLPASDCSGKPSPQTRKGGFVDEANLTRFGPKSLERKQGESKTFSAAFRAIDGPAKLILQRDGIDDAQIKVNGHDVVEPQDSHGNGEAVVPLHLGMENSIEVGVPSGPAGSLGVRVTQVTRADLGLQRQGYLGLNTSNMERQRAFYDTLGFTGEIYPAGPERSITFARSLGFADDYLIYVSLHSLQDPPVPPFVDTVQFRGDSYREEPPYANLNHIGMAYATYATTGLDGAFDYLQSRSVEFVSPPATAPNGERFVFLKDQDGAFLKLIETAEGEGGTHAPNLVRLVNTNMNVADLERSREFYRLLGFTESEPGSQAGSGEFARAHGFDGSIEFEGADVSLGEGTDGATLQLRRWKTPYDAAPSYLPPVNHLGIDRINYYVKDLTATIATMNEFGFEQLGPIGGSPGFGIMLFFDPDGIKVQFAGPRSWFDKALASRKMDP